MKVFFKGKNGLGQGDPLSPYLFVIFMEVLSQMLGKATATGSIKFHPKCEKLNLSHLCFADDLLIFFEVSFGSLQGLERVMADLQSLSGLGVSYNKSELYCSGIPMDLQVQLATAMGVKLGSLPVRYLRCLSLLGSLLLRTVIL